MEKQRFEGAFEDINPLQLNFIASVLESRGFSKTKVTIEVVGKIGDNYSGFVKRFTALKEGQSFKTVAKIPSSNKQVRNAMYSHITFTNECIMYTEILPKFTELEKTANIAEKERLRYAACYGTLLEEPFEVILLEDLNESGFIMFDKLKSLTNDHVKAILQSFAKLHSLSYILKRREPETFAEFSNKFYFVFKEYFQLEHMKLIYNQLEEDVITIIGDEKYKNAVKGTVSKLAEIVSDTFEMARESEFAVILHGDPWANNLMFNVKDDKTINCCMIDYQVPRIGTPTFDLSYTIFNCTDYETRAKNYSDWLDYYHSELASRLAIFGLEIDDVYPKKQLLADMKNQAKFAFAHAIFVASVVVRDPESAAKVKNVFEQSDTATQDILDASRIISSNKQTVELFKAKVEGLIDSLQDFGYIWD